MKPMPGSEFQIPADLVLLAMGFLHPVQEGIVKDLRLDLDPRGNVKANELDYRTSRAKVFAAGDMRRGQSLVVWAIREGRQAAHAIDKFLMGKTEPAALIADQHRNSRNVRLLALIWFLGSALGSTLIRGVMTTIARRAFPFCHHQGVGDQWPSQRAWQELFERRRHIRGPGCQSGTKSHF